VSTATELAAIRDFLATPTPDSWLEQAVLNQDLLLIDHANCEKKAASTALGLMHRYVEQGTLLERMSRLAREELRHFEQVRAVIARRGIAFRRVRPTRYAGGLHRVVRSAEPGRLVDLLIAGAFIEARSAERFAVLAPALDRELGAFYASLHAAEARHCRTYLDFAQAQSDAPIDARVRAFSSAEAELITQPDARFGFHSGPPA